MHAGSGSHSTVSNRRTSTRGAANMKSEEWKSYRTRFLVNAKQLDSTLSFVDHLGRQHRGRKGDYLVETFDGVLSIAPRRIFEDIYVPMPQFDDPRSGEIMIATQRPLNSQSIPQRSADLKIEEPQINQQNIGRLQFEALDIEQIRLGKSPVDCQRIDDRQMVGHDRAARVQRKLPQPCRDRSPSGSRLGLM